MATKKKVERTEREQTIVITLETTYVLKGKKCLTPSTIERPKENFPMEMLDLNLCPNADHFDIKKIKVFEKE